MFSLTFLTALHKKSESRRIDPKITLPAGESAAAKRERGGAKP
jgi:hypothetical protein